MAEHTSFADAFTPGSRLGSTTSSWRMTVRHLGEMSLPTGRLVVWDPYAEELDAWLLDAVFPSGLFRVDVAFATHEQRGDVVIAALRIVFGDDAVRRWEPVARERERAHPPYELPTHRVESGFTEVLDDETRRAWSFGDEGSGDPPVAELLPSGAPTRALVTGGSGRRGDYTSWIGRDDRGGAVQLCIDFDVLTEPVIDAVDLELPLSPGPVQHPLFEDLRVEAIARTMHEIELRGDVARVAFGRQSGSSIQPQITTRPQFVQTLTFKGDEPAQVLVYRGRRALPRL